MKPLADLATDWSSLSPLLDEALALTGEQRSAWLDALRLRPGVSAALHIALQDLLGKGAGVETGDFMSTLPRLGAAAPAATPALQAGTTIGPYRLISELGHGGMGSVWLAERSDGQLKRKVALKLPHLSWSGNLAERLARERDILATLEHPQITRLYDAGVDAQGRPYLAMEYVQGEPIDVYCRRHALGMPARLALVLQVADAVAHAHSRLVVHRDLKPSNILVTPEGQARLLDFGIAKLLEGERTEATELTRLGGTALTPDYASPEQIRGEPLGTASDQYSLAVVTYELLSGERPYRLKRGSAAELEEAIASVEPPLASSRAATPAMSKALRGDLDAILNRALRKTSTERYVSVDAFARDIERHLHNQPIEARPDRRWARVCKFVRRNRLAVGISGVVASTVVTAAGVAVWQAVVARHQANRAEVSASQQRAVRDLYVEVMNVLAAAAADDAAMLAKPHAVSEKLKATLKLRAAQLTDRPREHEALLDAVGIQLSYTGDYNGALDVGREYLAHLKAHGGESWKIARAHLRVASALFHLGRSNDERIAEVRMGLAAAPEVADPDLQRARMDLRSTLGHGLWIKGEWQEAERVLLEADAAGTRWFPRDEERYTVLFNLALLYADRDPPKSLGYLRRVHAAAMAGSEVHTAGRISSQEYLGQMLLANNLAAEAAPHLQLAHAGAAQNYGLADRDTVRILGLWSTALHRTGGHDQARELLAQQLGALDQKDTPDARDARSALRGQMFENEWAYGDLQAALGLLQGDPVARMRNPNLRDADVTLVAEVQALAAAGRSSEALAQATALTAALTPTQRQRSVGFTYLLAEAEALLNAGKPQQASAAAESLLVALREQGMQHAWVGQVTAEVMSLALLRTENPAKALVALNAWRIPSTQHGPGAAPSPLERAESALRRAEVLAAAERKEDSVAAARAALADLTHQHPHSPRLLRAKRLAGLSL